MRERIISLPENSWLQWHWHHIKTCLLYSTILCSPPRWDWPIRCKCFQPIKTHLNTDPASSNSPNSNKLWLSFLGVPKLTNPGVPLTRYTCNDQSEISIQKYWPIRNQSSEILTNQKSAFINIDQSEVSISIIGKPEVCIQDQSEVSIENLSQ